MALTTRATLRARIARQLREPFFLTYTRGSIETVGTGLSVDTIPLGGNFADIYPQANNWAGQHVYIMSSSATELIDTEYYIRRGTGSAGELVVAPEPSTQVPNGTEVQLFARVTAVDIHEAINEAIRTGYPYFYDVATFDLCIPENIAEFDATTELPTDWNTLLDVYLEPFCRMMGPYEGNMINSETFVVTSTDLLATMTTDLYEGWEVRIVGDNYTSRVRTVDANSTTQITTVTPIITDTDEGLPVRPIRFYLAEVNTRNMGREWQKMTALLPNEGPTLQSVWIDRYLRNRPGMKIRLRGMKVCAELDQDADTTPVPSEYITYYACSHLAMHLRGGESSSSAQNMWDVGRWDAGVLEDMKKRLAFRRISGTNWGATPYRAATNNLHNDGNPLDWH